LQLLQAASAEMKKLAQEGKCWDVAEREFKLPGYENWPGLRCRPAVHRPPLLRLLGGVPEQLPERRAPASETPASPPRANPSGDGSTQSTAVETMMSKRSFLAGAVGLFVGQAADSADSPDGTARSMARLLAEIERDVRETAASTGRRQLNPAVLAAIARVPAPPLRAAAVD
jgi:hypothetical protein